MTFDFGSPFPFFSTLVADSFQTARGAAATTPGALALERWVNPAGGSDANAGGLETPMLTLQAAYDDMVTEAEATASPGAGQSLYMGTIGMYPGQHNVGTGLVLDPLRPCLFRGAVHIGQSQPDKTTINGQQIRDITRLGPMSIIHSTSIDPTGLMILDGTSQPGGGFGFQYITFWVDNDNDNPNDPSNPALQHNMLGVIYTRNISEITIRDCQVQTTWNWAGYFINSDATAADQQDDWIIENVRVQDAGVIEMQGGQVARGWQVRQVYSLQHLTVTPNSAFPCFRLLDAEDW